MGRGGRGGGVGHNLPPPPPDPSHKILTLSINPLPSSWPRPYSDVKHPRLRDSPPLWKGKFDANSAKNWHGRKMGAKLTRRVWPFLPPFHAAVMSRDYTGVRCNLIHQIRNVYFRCSILMGLGWVRLGWVGLGWVGLGSFLKWYILYLIISIPFQKILISCKNKRKNILCDT